MIFSSIISVLFIITISSAVISSVALIISVTALALQIKKGNHSK